MKIPLLQNNFFWVKHPALLLGISLLVGTSSTSFYLWPILWSVYLASIRKWIPILLTFAGILYGSFAQVGPMHANAGYFSINSVKPHQSPFHKSLLYRGWLYVDGKRVPCTVHQPSSQTRPSADTDYIVQGNLFQRGQYDYLFRATKWIKVPHTWSLAEMRFQAKEWLRSLLDQKLKGFRVSSFLSSLITGDVQERSLRYEFGRLGLQHILAISGFHFAILIAFCSFFLQFFLQSSQKYIALLILINLYFLFIGSVPAVQRSWLTALFYLVGKLIGRNTNGLNLLGAALLIEVLLDPLISAQVGFQLSFASCFGILLLHAPFKMLMAHIFPPHRPGALTKLAQHGLICTSFLKEALSLTLAVNTAILPIILYHFHSFPLLSIGYNLFFPFLVAIALFLLLLSLLTFILCPFVSPILFQITDFFTVQTLDLAAYPPLLLDFSIQVKNFPSFAIPPYLFTLLCTSIAFQKRFLLTNTPSFE